MMLLRADAGVRIGSGHVMRCVALAQAWRDAGRQAVFVTATPSSALEALVRTERMDVRCLSAVPGSDEDIAQTLEIARAHGASRAAVDGYHFGAEYQRALRGSGLRVLAMDDDGHAGHYYAAWVLNQNRHAQEPLYAKREPSTQLLLGTRYVLLRREWTRWRGWHRETPEVARRILVTLGGGDPENVTLKVVHALRHSEPDGVEVEVVLGTHNPNGAEVRRALQGSRVPVRLRCGATAMDELMAWADLAVSAGGSTCWELAFMGVPSVAIMLAENQRPIVEALDAEGAAVSLGWHAQCSPGDIASAVRRLSTDSVRRAAMSRRGQALVDGEGAGRVVRALTAHEEAVYADPVSRE